jgi:hypothetical protein
MIDRQDLLELHWAGGKPLYVLGPREEPVFRLSEWGIDINLTSPTTWRVSERFARVPVPGFARFGVRPRWERIEGPGVWRWAEHRAQWMRAGRPAAVGDGSEATTIFRWSVPLRVGAREAQINGVLEWVPDVRAVRAERSAVSHPLLSAAILVVAMIFGAGAGVYARERLRPRAARDGRVPRVGG